MSGNAEYLLAGTGVGPAKLAKATKLGVRMLSEEEFERMIGERHDEAVVQPTLF